MVLADSILYLQIEIEFKLTRSFNGLTTLVSVLSAMPSYYFSEYLLNTRGAVFMFRCAQVLTCLRFFLLSFVTADTAFLIIPLQLLHGVCFSMNWSAATDAFQAASPPGITSSAQVIVTMLYFTLGQGLGYTCWSAYYQKVGASLSFSTGSFILLVNLLSTKFPKIIGNARLSPDQDMG